MTKQYDADYFQRWYRDGDIGGAPRLARKVALAVAVAEYHLERPIRTVLDVGCGEGAWRAPLLKLRPKLQYLGFDSSEYAVRRFGRTRNLHHARFEDFQYLRPCAPVDLLVCSDVLHYLPTRELKRGLPGLAQDKGSDRDPLLVLAVDRSIDGCEVLVVSNDLNDIRPLPEFSDEPARLRPAR